MLSISDADIGGARVRRLFQGGKYRAGMMLTADEVLAMNGPNRKALVEQGYIELWPKPPIEHIGNRHIVHLGKGLYDVIQGRKLNDEPLSKEDAEEVATRPE